MTEDLEKRVRDIVVRKLRVNPEQVTREASFIDDLGADSLDATELVLALEEEFDVSIPQKDATGLKTVGDVLDYIAKNNISAQPVKKGFLRRLFAMFLKREHLTVRHGFTLVELLVVVAILGILGAVAVTNVVSHIENTRKTAAKTAVDNVRSAKFSVVSNGPDGEPNTDDDIRSDSIEKSGRSNEKQNYKIDVYSNVE